MDTREKIIPLERVVACARGAAVVTGYFDVLAAEHVRQLERARRDTGLVVVLFDPPAPVLAARARAEMVAALRVVDYVVIAEEPGPATQRLLEELEPAAIVRLEAEHARQSDELIAHVRQRHTS
ncbi:MAG: hypothetical protein ACE15B_17995 [Bryobacteraceae bacterium]